MTVKWSAQIWGDMKIGARLTLGISVILSLTVIVGLIGWYSLGYQADSQVLANRAIDLVSALRAARQSEKNYVLTSDEKYIQETFIEIKNIQSNAEILRNLLDDKNKVVVLNLLNQLNEYAQEFRSYVELNKKKNNSLGEMVVQGRDLENSAIILRDDQKKELLRLEKLAIASSAQRLKKSEKADDANRMIKLMNEARLQEKDFLLTRNIKYLISAKKYIEKLISQAYLTKSRFGDNENISRAQDIILSAKNYLNELENLIYINISNKIHLDKLNESGQIVGNLAVQLREDQKEELLSLEKLSREASRQRQDKREKADLANRIIKLMTEARQQEKNFLLRKHETYAVETRTLVDKAVTNANSLRKSFQDSENRKLVDKIIIAAESYLKQFEKVFISETEQNIQQMRMIHSARKIENMASFIRSQMQLKATSVRNIAENTILFTLFLALLIGLCVAMLLTNSISKPIFQLVDVINRMAAEDQVSVPLVSHKDEIGQIARALSDFKEVILERKKITEKQLVESEKMAALGNLVAGVAHEINTPIGIAVTGSSHINDQVVKLEKNFKEGVLNKGEFKRFIENIIPTSHIINNNLERASSLIKSFKQVAVDQSSLEKRKIHVVEYIKSIVLSLRPKLNDYFHKVIIQGDEDLSIVTIPGALSQIITNLIMNSLVHGFSNNLNNIGNIFIHVYEVDSQWVLFYKDNGTGMAEEIKRRMYEPFFTTQRGAGGSGLGLSIVYNLVTQTLNGNIECNSYIDKGTSFKMQFPL